MLRSRALRLLGLAPLTLAACNSPAVPPMANYATIYGTVYDGATGQPLPGASISIDQVLTGSSNASGTFSVGNVPTGPFTVVTSAQGYTSRTDTGTVMAGAQFQLIVNLYK